MRDSRIAKSIAGFYYSKKIKKLQNPRTGSCVSQKVDEMLGLSMHDSNFVRRKSVASGRSLIQEVEVAPACTHTNLGGFSPSTSTTAALLACFLVLRTPYQRIISFLCWSARKGETDAERCDWLVCVSAPLGSSGLAQGSLSSLPVE